MRVFRLLLPFASAVAALSRPAVAAPEAEGIAFFEKNIRPVLVSKCYKCHAADAEKLKGGLLLDTRDGTLQGGDSGPAVVPGNLDKSLLLGAIRYTDKDMRMPPEKSGGKLPADVIANFEAWVKMGAPDPREGGAPVVTKAIDFEKAREFWAFKAPALPAVPAVQNAAWARTELDRFVLAKLEEKALSPVPDSERRALLRRLYFDLVGLPPPPEQVEAFARDAASDAVAKVVDDLLASPRFGERWARHWLDVARFAESAGKERNLLFPEAWRYRDYVISAFNTDKPYDEFIREQIAGDLLPAKDDAERDEHLIATGFLALGPKGLNEKNREQFRMDLIDEQIDATSRAVLGLTVACARCHDHKYDPIPQRDYYALAGIFRSTETRFGTVLPAAKPGQNRHGTALIPLTTTPAATTAASDLAPSAAVPGEEELRRRFRETLADRPERAKRFAALPPARKARVFARFMAESRGQKKNATAAEQTATAPSQPQAMGVIEGRTTPARLLGRGEIDQPGEPVPRGFVTVLMDGPAPNFSATQSGRRELAEWLVSPKNPLTARVMVNRVWAHLFGQGLVATGDNFGVGGEKPSHPELLDFLAVKFSSPKEQGGLAWSVKKLVRQLVLSRTYQLSSATQQAALGIDPDNRLLWRAAPRRLDAEAIRDAILSASGTIELTPPRGSMVSTVREGMRGVRPETFTKYQSKHRSVYLPIVRDLAPEALEVFDFAEPSLIVAARDVTNVPAQALYLMNNTFVRDQAAARAWRVLATPLDHAGRISLAYQLALSRQPTPAELQRAQQYLLGEARGLIAAKHDSVADAGEASWATFCQALFACAEFRYLR